jgi:hypothetical protein
MLNEFNQEQSTCEIEKLLNTRCIYFYIFLKMFANVDLNFLNGDAKCRSMFVQENEKL